MSLKYNAGRDAFAEGRLSWSRDKIVAHLVSAAYVASDAHTDVRDLKGLIGEPVVLTGKSVRDGWLRAAKIIFQQVSGPDAVAIVIRRETAAERDKVLIGYLDDIEKFPMKLNGGDVEVLVPERGLLRI